MDTRKIAKMAAKIVVGTAVGSLITKTLVANVPKSERLKAAEMAGALGGAIAADKLEPNIDKIIDDLFAWYEAKKN